MIKRLTALLTAAFIAAAAFPAAAYASGADPEEWKEDYYAEGEWHDFEEDDEKTDGLTPEGNLTLVDDYGDAPEEGQQFITLVTKNGNYFYLIIDRDKDGEQTVHFLNLVDESDLFALLEEDEQEAYKAQVEAELAAKEAAEKAAAEAAASAVEIPAETKPEKKHVNLFPLAGVILLIIAAAGGWVLMQTKKKKMADQAPDPDADYVEYEDDYGISPDEEADEPDEWEDADDGSEGYDA